MVGGNNGNNGNKRGQVMGFVAPIAAIVCALSLLSAKAEPHDSAKSCAAGDATVMRRQRVFLDSNNAKADLQVYKGLKGSREVIVTGPVLGSMDSPDVEATLSCSETGLVLTETVVRSAEYSGAAAKNVLWQPITEINVLLKAPSVMFKVIWNISPLNGKSLDQSQTRPSDHSPVVLTATIY